MGRSRKNSPSEHGLALGCGGFLGVENASVAREIVFVVDLSPKVVDEIVFSGLCTTKARSEMPSASGYMAKLVECIASVDRLIAKKPG